MTTTQILSTRIYNGTSIKARDVIFFCGRRFGVGAVPAEGEGRKVYQGPMVPGPWPTHFATATVIADHYIAPEPAVDVEEGDLVEIEESPTASATRKTERLCNDDWLALDNV